MTRLRVTCRATGRVAAGLMLCALPSGAFPGGVTFHTALLWRAPLFDADTQYLLQVAGLSNARRAAALERTLEALEGVEKVRSDSDTGIVTVVARGGLRRQVAARAARAAGLELRSFGAASRTTGPARGRR